MSSPSDRVPGTPPTNTSADTPLEETPAESTRSLETGLAIQQRERETTLRDLARLRKEASAEIERLLVFMDASDPYASAELEENGDEDEDSDPGEDGADDEPSLGSHEIREAGAVSYVARAVCGGGEYYQDCEADDCDREDDDPDEPKLQPAEMGGVA